MIRLRVLTVLAATVLGLLPRPAAAQEEPAKPQEPAQAPAPTAKPPVATPATPAPAASKSPAPAPVTAVPPAPGTPPARPALLSAIESTVGAEVHGRFTVRWESRILRGDDGRETDHDLFGVLDARIGDDAHDRFSGALLARTDWDLDSPEHRSTGRVFTSLGDTFDHAAATLLYTAYGQWRPASGKVESFRLGRQFVDVAETFHVDGAAAQSGVLHAGTKLRVKAYAGVPVHFYERGSSGDWLAGAQATADLRKGTRGALDVAHVQDDLAGFTKERNDLAALSLWQKVGANSEAFGRFTWLDGPRDMRLRWTHTVPEHDLLFQASYRRVFEEQEQLATEFDPYFAALRTYHPYHLGDLRAVKGFGEKWQVEVGASARELVEDDDLGPYNRETRRVWLSPSVDDLWWEGSSFSAGVDSWSGEGQRIRTWTADVTQRFGKKLKASVGSDFSLYDYGRLARGEREHVRTVYVRADWKVASQMSVRVRYSRERDEEETYHVVSLALGVDF